MPAKLPRRLPPYSELRPLMQFAPPRFGTEARLAKVADVWDLRRIARRRTPKAAFDYTDGAALREIGYARNRAAFDNVELVPAILSGSATVDLSVDIAGGRSSLPFGIAPTGFTRFMQTEGEFGGAGAAGELGVPYTLSTMGTRSIEEVAEHNPDTRRWFQLYLWADRDKSGDLLRRAKQNGYDTLLVTVDTPVAGQRLRDVRNGMTIPPKLTLKTIADASVRPQWWFDFLTTDPLTFASLSGSTRSLPDIINSIFEPTLSMDDLAWIRTQWDGPLFVKGILNPTDARKAREVGADGLVVSNHGARQLDRAPVSLLALPEVRAAVGPDVEIILDSGIMSGSDVIAALALGADFTLIGRAYLYGLMAGGQAGVAKVLQILRDEMIVGMQLMGAGSVAELTPEMVKADWRD